MLWTASRDGDGYGQFKLGSGNPRAHRVSYVLAFGAVPNGLQLDHLCRVRHCVAPAHLEPVTGQVNVLRGQTPAATNVAKTHCPQGHEYDKANTYVDAKGRRNCRHCQRIRARTYRRRKAA